MHQQKDIFSKDPVHKQQAKSKWLSSFQKLCEIFQEHAPVALSKRLPLHYLKQFCSKSLIKDSSFITLISMKRVLAKEKDRINPISNRSHACYLERLCNDFQKIVITHFNRDLRAIIQFVGITGESRNIRLALLSLCYQIAYIYNVSINLSEPLVAFSVTFCQVFDLTDSCQRLHQVHISSEDIPIHKDHSILVSNNSVKDYVLFAYRNGKEALVFSARKGEVVAKLTSQEPVAAIQGVAVTKEYFLVIFRDHFVIWNMETGFVKDRIKPEYKDQAPPQPILLGHLLSKDTRTLYKDILSKRKRGKGTTVFQMPWERRNESKTAKKRWLENEVKQELEKLQQLANEKYNAIDQYLLSGDEKVKK
ncbi:unnamed protein product [Caretta caretta]